MPDFNLPSLSSRLRPLLTKLAADESHLTSNIGADLPNLPKLVGETVKLVESILVKVMEEIEKGPGF